MIGVLVDSWMEVVMVTSVDLRVEIMILVLAMRIFDALDGGPDNFDAAVFGEVFTIAVLDVIIALEVVLPALYTIDLRSDLMIEMLAVKRIGVACAIGVAVFVNVCTDIRDAPMTPAESMSILASSKAFDVG